MIATTKATAIITKITHRHGIFSSGPRLRLGLGDGSGMVFITILPFFLPKLGRRRFPFGFIHSVKGGIQLERPSNERIGCNGQSRPRPDEGSDGLVTKPFSDDPSQEGPGQHFCNELPAQPHHFPTDTNLRLLILDAAAGWPC